MNFTNDQFRSIFTSFRKSSDKFIEELLSSSVYKKIDEGTFLYSEGDSCPGIGFFLSGEVRVFKVAESGREVTLYEIFPGQTCILNAASILSNRQYPANAVSVTEGALLFMKDVTFRRFMAEYEEMRAFIFSHFSERLGTMIELIEDIVFGKMDKRLVSFLIEKAENNVVNSTHQQIANELGSSREVISRILKDMEKKGRVMLSRNMIRVDDL
jgi:CRP/FNR family transcriptional regulator